MFRSVLIALMLAVTTQAADMLPGTVLVSRWYDEKLNTSPGTENHLAIYVGNGQIVEAQSDRGVITTPLSEYLARPQHVTKLLPRTPEIGAVAAAKAKSFVGKPYGPLASIGPLWRFGRDNCVSVVENAYRPQTGFVWGIRRPDHIYKLVQW